MGKRKIIPKGMGEKTWDLVIRDGIQLGMLQVK